MSSSAPWLALAIDWQDSEMFDDANHGERLAWICLLCFVKAQGRAGRARLRDKAFAQRYRLTVEAVDGMLAKAARAGAVTIDGEGVVNVVNWRKYQDPRVRHSTDDNHKPAKQLEKDGTRFTKTAATDHQITRSPNHQTPDHPKPRNRSRGSGRSGKSGVWKTIDRDRLASPALLREWFNEEVRRPDTPLNGSERCWHDVQAAAAKSLRDQESGACNDAVALFKWICGFSDGKSHFDHLDGDDEDAAANRRRQEVRQ